MRQTRARAMGRAVDSAQGLPRAQLRAPRALKNGNEQTRRLVFTERNWAKLGFQKGISKILVIIRIEVGQHGSGEGAQITAAVFVVP